VTMSAPFKGSSCDVMWCQYPMSCENTFGWEEIL